MMKSVTKEKVFHVLKLILLAVTVTLVLLSLLGTVAHASGLVDDTVNADNLYSKYPLSNYQLDFYVDNSWSWLPWNWLDGIVGSVNTYNQNDNEQESHIESTAGKSVFGHSGKCLNTFPNTICHVIDEVQLIRLLHHIPCGIAKIQADCPDKICDTVKPVLH